MALGKVIINNLQQNQGAAPEIERKALFVGVGSTGVGTVIALNAQSDLDTAVGADSELKRNLVAAKLNGGESWEAFAAPQNSGYDLEQVILDAMQVCSPELIVVCTPAQSAADFTDAYDISETLRTTFARRVIFLYATPQIDSTDVTGQTWADYIADQAALTDSVAANRVCAVPQIHGNNLGVLAGRLCNRAVSIADSPMRVKSGPVFGLGAAPLDMSDVPLTGAVLSALDSNRLSVPQEYPDYAGTYWGDANLLDVPGGDYQVIENLRVMDKAARRVRLLAISDVANRSFNNTPGSIASKISFYGRPLRAMSKSATVGDIQFPGEILPPKDDAVTIVWPSKTQVEIYLKLQPYNSPKEIVANLLLDLNS